jgi:uncharacterized membrane protein YhaH (DUF805 family)
MFQSPFSFNGRIRRTEYGFSFIIYVVAYIVIVSMMESSNDGVGSKAILFIPLVWFMFAQGAKRCHDLGKRGIWQIVPFYTLWLVFKDGEFGENEYGINPKNGGMPAFSSENSDPIVIIPNESTSSSADGGGHIDLSKPEDRR